MKLTRQTYKPERPSLNMAAMIDVVFLLLIFFMCTTSFTPPESELLAQLPRIEAGQGGREDFEPVRIYLSVAESNPAVLIQCDGLGCDDFSHLREMLTARKAIADVRVIIGGDPTVPFEYMVQAMDVCYDAGLERVAFSANE
ncbi:MAG: biopolymer transporter ExbD [Phycisphaerae bacterium]|nr:biopolymer transporter ExbD [Phycisphaerae bacterium]